MEQPNRAAWTRALEAVIAGVARDLAYGLQLFGQTTSGRQAGLPVCMRHSSAQGDCSTEAVFRLYAAIWGARPRSFVAG